MEITLTSDIEKALVAEAKDRGTTPEELALESLRRQFVHPTLQENGVVTDETLADTLSGFIGILRSGEHRGHMEGKGRLSESTGKAFVKLLIKKRQQGRL